MNIAAGIKRTLQVVLSCASLMVSAVNATQMYTAVPLGTLGGSHSFGYGINSSGQATGHSLTTGDLYNRAFIYSGGVMTELGALDGRMSWGRAINDSGQVSGWSDINYSSASRAFLFSSGVMTAIGTLGGTDSSGRGINNLGEVVGSATTYNNSEAHAFRYASGVLTDLGTLGWIASDAFAINDSGQVTGWSAVSCCGGPLHAFLYSGGVMTDLGTLGGFNSQGTAINAKGQVAGWSMIGDNNQNNYAFIYSDGVMTNLGTLHNAYDSLAWGINDSAQVVGWSNTSNGSQHAAIWNGTSISDLNDLIEPSMLGNGWELYEARGINNNGWIIANGRNAVWGPFPGQQMAFLLVPIPPSDTTPPNITPIIAGTLGLNGWHISAVTVTWDVLDDESSITTQTGCGTAILSNDTGGAAITCNATSGGGSNSNTVTIKIDQTPPTINCAVTPNVLWSPNHKLVSVAATVNVADTVSGSSGFALVSVTSNEPDAGLNKSDVPTDIQEWTLGTSDVNGQVRAERSDAGSGRVYTVSYRGEDGAGNIARCNTTVAVPLNQRK